MLENFLSKTFLRLACQQIIFPVALATAIFSCKENSTESSVAHKKADLIQEDVAWHFVKMSREEILKDLSSGADTSNPLYTRAQKATEQVWKAALAIDPRIGASNAQKPLALIQNDGSINAWVNSSRLCIKNGAAATLSGALLGSNFRFYKPNQNCFEPVRPVSPKAFVTWFNAQGAACKIGLKSQGFSFNPDCNGAFTEAEMIMVPAPTPAITYSDGLLKEASDDELVYIAAHELGHYLRTHHMYLENKYQYFYRENEKSRQKKPTPEPSFLEKGKELVGLYKTDAEDFGWDSRPRLKPNPRREALYAEAANMGLGFYTTEQEADEIAIEIMASLKVNLRAAIDFQLKRLKNPYKNWRYDHEKCTTLQRNKWMENGKRVAIAMEGLDDPHHNPCYRAWNMEQEITAHGFH